MIGVRQKHQRRLSIRGNMTLMIPLVIAVMGGAYLMSDSFKGHQIVGVNEQNKVEATKMVRSFYQLVVRKSLEGRSVVSSAPAEDQCPELSAFKNLAAAAADLTKSWTASTLPTQWCGVTLASVFDVSRVDGLKLDVRRETADVAALTSVIYVNISLTTKSKVGRPGGQGAFSRRLLMRAPRLADYALVLKGLPQADTIRKERFRLGSRVTHVEVRGPMLVDAGVVTPEQITDEAEKPTPRVVFNKVHLTGSTAMDAEAGVPVSLDKYFKVFPTGIHQEALSHVTMPYDEISRVADASQYRDAFGVQFDFSVRSALSPRLPLVAYSGYTSRLGPAPGGTEFNGANAAAAYSLPVTAVLSGFNLGLDETCTVRPSASVSTVAPLVLNSREGATVTIDFTKNNENYICAFINTDTLRIVLRPGGRVNTLVGTFMARRVSIEGEGGLIIAHPRTVAVAGGGEATAWPGQVEQPWPYSAGETTTHFTRFSDTTANGYYRPMYHFDEYYNLNEDAVSPAYEAMRPYALGRAGNSVGYYQPTSPDGTVLFPVAPVATDYSAMSASEWLGVMYYLEPIL